MICCNSSGWKRSKLGCRRADSLHNRRVVSRPTHSERQSIPHPRTSARRTLICSGHLVADVDSMTTHLTHRNEYAEIEREREHNDDITNFFFGNIFYKLPLVNTKCDRARKKWSKTVSTTHANRDKRFRSDSFRSHFVKEYTLNLSTPPTQCIRTGGETWCLWRLFTLSVYRFRVCSESCGIASGKRRLCECALFRLGAMHHDFSRAEWHRLLGEININRIWPNRRDAMEISSRFFCAAPWPCAVCCGSRRVCPNAFAGAWRSLIAN